MNYVAIFIGGGIGSMVRFAMTKFNGSADSNWFTLGTLLANLISCFILGIVISLHYKNGWNDNLKLLLITGFCGGFSTFSTFSFELFNYLQKGSYWIAMLYVSASVFLGLGMIISGMKIAS
jgi:CrcB protein